MSVARLIKRLEEGGFDFRAEDVLDALWLANQRRSLASALPPVERATPRPAPPAPGPAAGAGESDGESSGSGAEDRSGSGQQQDEPPDQQARQSPADSGGLLYSGGQLSAADRTVSASAVATPAARALPKRLELMRALRPLRQRWPSAQVSELDEEATAQLTADLQRRDEPAIYPVFRPRLERWFECDLILEDDDAVEIWRDPLREFAQTLRDSGAFREVRSWRLRLPADADAADLARVRLEAPAGGRVAAGRLSGGIRRLILFATHGASRHWRDGTYARLLGNWAADANLALVHLLPRDMWLRTALGEAQGRCATTRPGSSAAGLDVEAYWWMPGPDPERAETLRLPVLELEPHAVEEWSAMLMARGRSAPLFLLDRTAGQAAPAEADDDERVIERRLDALREASPEAFRLAVILSVCPFTIPVAHLMQEAKFGAVDNRQLAELFLSGLIRSIPPAAGMPCAGETWYGIVERAKPLLLRSMRGAEAASLSREIFERVSSYLETIAGRAVTIASFTPDENGKYQIPEWAQPFARMATSLRALAPAAPAPATGLEQLRNSVSSKILGRLARMAAANRPLDRQLIGPYGWQRLLAAGITAEGTDGRLVLEAEARVQLAELDRQQPLLGFRILWVDDFPQNNDVYVAEVIDAGGSVEQVTTTEAGLAALEAGFDLVVSDMGRGAEQFAGFDLINAMRELASAPPIIIFSGPFAGSEQRRDEVRKAGAIGCTNDGTELFEMVLAVARGEPLPASVKRSDEPDEEARLETLGSQALEKGDFELAEQLFTRQLRWDESQGDHDGAYRAHHSLGRVAAQRGHFEAAERWHLKGLEIAQKMEEEYFIEGSCAQLGRFWLARGDLPAAQIWFEKALHHANRTQEGEGIPRACFELGEVAEARHDLDEAIYYYKRAAEAKSEWDDSSKRAWIRFGALAGHRGDAEAAVEGYLALLELCDPSRDFNYSCIAYVGLGEAEEFRHNFAAAEQWYEQVVKAGDQAGDQVVRSKGFLALAGVAEKRGDLEQSRRSYDEALEAARQSGSDKQIGQSLTDMAEFELRHRGLTAAWTLYQEALGTFRKVEDPPGEAALLFRMGSAALGSKDLIQAEASLVHALEIAEKLDDRPLMAAALHALGRVAQASADYHQAEFRYQASLAVLEQIRDVAGIAATCHSLGRLMSASGRPSEAEEMYRRALEIRLQLGDTASVELIQQELHALTAASPPAPSPAAGSGPALKISSACTRLVQEFHGIGRARSDGRFEAYQDVNVEGFPWTIGWGTTGPDIKEGLVWTREQCDQRLASDLEALAEKVARMIGAAPTTQSQFDALVSFAHGTGPSTLSSSKLLAIHKAGHFAGAARELANWSSKSGRPNASLERRRAKEAKLYEGATEPPAS